MMRRVKEKVIELTDEKKKEVEDKFKISHSKSCSETFVPHFFYDKERDIVFADVAGMNDTSTGIIRILNCFIMLFIFKQAKSVRFLMTLNADKFKGKTLTVAPDFVNIQQICFEGQQDHKKAKSLLPIITKLTDKTKDIEDLRFDA